VTLYLGPDEVHLTPGLLGLWQNLSANRYFVQSGAATMIESSDGTTTYEVTNNQGTGDTVIDAATGEITARRYTTPYGQTRGDTPLISLWPDDHTFLGKTTDISTGLVDVGARKYDPSTGRFISADPIFQANSPQEIGGYAYAGNDPVSASDPTGLTRCDADPGICSTATQISLGALPGCPAGYHDNGHGCGADWSVGPDLSPKPGEHAYDKAAQDIQNLPPGLVKLGLAYSAQFQIPWKLVIALLAQEENVYEQNGLELGIGKGAYSAVAYDFWDLGIYKGVSLGVAHMKAKEARRVMAADGYQWSGSEDALYQALIFNDEFNVSVASLDLAEFVKVDGMSNKGAYLAYAASAQERVELQDPSSHPVQLDPVLSRRSARYDAYMAYLSQFPDSATAIVPVPKYFSGDSPVSGTQFDTYGDNATGTAVVTLQ
jgi:RHS repeat-associated protein